LIYLKDVESRRRGADDANDERSGPNWSGCAGAPAARSLLEGSGGRVILPAVRGNANAKRGRPVGKQGAIEKFVSQGSTGGKVPTFNFQFRSATPPTPDPNQCQKPKWRNYERQDAVTETKQAPQANRKRANNNNQKEEAQGGIKELKVDLILDHIDGPILVRPVGRPRSHHRAKPATVAPAAASDASDGDAKGAAAAGSNNDDGK
jgi:hypothetical protein